MPWNRRPGVSPEAAVGGPAPEDLVTASWADTEVLSLEVGALARAAVIDSVTSGFLGLELGGQIVGGCRGTPRLVLRHRRSSVEQSVALTMTGNRFTVEVPLPSMSSDDGVWECFLHTGLRRLRFVQAAGDTDLRMTFGTPMQLTAVPLGGLLRVRAYASDRAAFNVSVTTVKGYL